MAILCKQVTGKSNHRNVNSFPHLLNMKEEARSYIQVCLLMCIMALVLLIFGCTEQWTDVAIKCDDLNKNCTFEIPMTLKPGKNLIRLKAEDNAGNVAIKEITLFYNGTR